MIILLVLLLSWNSAVTAMPPLPSSFYGTVKADGKNVQSGSRVIALIDGVEYAWADVEMYGGDTVYSLDIPGDDAATPQVEGGHFGDTITFKIADKIAYETANWTSGVNINLDLTFPPISSPPVLPASYYGTVKIDNQNAPAGTVIKAKINGVVYAQDEVELFEGNAVYTLDIPGDDPATSGIIEGGTLGDTIQFMIGGLEADQSSTWESGTNTKLDLTINEKKEYQYLFPLIMQ